MVGKEGGEGYYVNCIELGKLVQSLPQLTRIKALTLDQFDLAFVPPLNLPPDYDFSMPGAIIMVVEGTPPVIDRRNPIISKKLIRDIYKENCLG